MFKLPSLIATLVVATLVTTSCSNDPASLHEVDSTISSDNLSVADESAPGFIPNDIGILELAASNADWRAYDHYNQEVIPLHKGKSYYENAQFEGIAIMARRPGFFSEAPAETKDKYLSALLARPYINNADLVLSFLEDAKTRTTDSEVARMASIVWEKADKLPEPQRESYFEGNRPAMSKIAQLGQIDSGGEL